MLDRMTAGIVPAKHHIALRDSQGTLLYEECSTRQGFEGAYTIAYHLKPPHSQSPIEVEQGWAMPSSTPKHPLLKRHYRSSMLGSPGCRGTETVQSPLNARKPLLFNEDVILSVLFPAISDSVYFSNADADDLFYIQSGKGVLRSPLGDVAFEAGDYLFVPRGMLHRFVLPADEFQHWLSIECLGGMGIPGRFRTQEGQLRMDAPYSHRDFKRPQFIGPQDEEDSSRSRIRTWVVKRSNQFFGFRFPTSPLDVVGWDGTVYPWAFPILNFQPRVGQVHLPPTLHGTFAARGALICSFVPRPLDFHPKAVPCPYPHASVDCDEFIFYSRGEFTSRRGIGPGSISHHPSGVPHGPHPGAYESSVGAKWTDELAVMLDTDRPLRATEEATKIEDSGYQSSFNG